MERKVSILIIAFVIMLLISLTGFYPSYLRFFPDFSKFPILIHVHFIAFLAWFGLLILQPILIKKRNYNLHRFIGKAGYILIPILVITIIFMVLHQVKIIYLKKPELASLTAFVGFIDVISILVYYSVAMINRKNIRWHVAFIIACSLVILNPGLSRLLNPLKPGLGIMVAVILPIVVSVSILTYEKLKYKYGIIKSPYLLFLCCWIIEVLLLFTVPKSEVWKEFVQIIAG